MITLIILLISVLLVSGVCSMVEAAILSLSSLRVRILLEQKRHGARDLLFLKENIHSAVVVIVLMNNSINIIGSIFVGQKALSLFGDKWLGVSSAVLTFLIVMLAEIIPKTIGEHYKVKISLGSAKILRFIIWFFRPLINILLIASNLFKRKSGIPRVTKVTEDEIRIMLKLGRDAGTVEVDEENLCNKVFKLNDVKAHHIMKNIGQIYALPSGQSLIEAKDSILNSQYSRIAAYENDVSNIVGVCQQRILLREIAKDNYDAKVKDFMTQPIFVDENEKADDLLTKFQANHQHLFIVKDKDGKNIGIVSMEDVLEELFGEIYDEKDKIVS